MLEHGRQFAEMLIAARRHAGLSQRALGAKVGVAQSHISKIERAAIDPQVSSLMELARALGLELMLVPAQLVPAVHALGREATPDPRRMPGAIDHDLKRLARQAQELTKRFPEARVLFDIAATANEMRIARLDTSTAREASPLIDAAATILKGLRGPRDHPPIEDAAVDANAEQALILTERALRNLRNVWTHRDASFPQAPAYRLDDPNA
ncbi:MAG TPA: helix-turn-helix domain-containing protein [Steroidobacteraceae bacterium]|jgi:transcriptional regulator with XRE-family HTH domain|nr:helix-turn-helix domain-containing protein [Steroidobacteraceae bacterium]